MPSRVTCTRASLVGPSKRETYCIALLEPTRAITTVSPGSGGDATGGTPAGGAPPAGGEPPSSPPQPADSRLPSETRPDRTRN
ncbi:hypothetical protein [Croceibacterium ferulae]|uniref:hypothetical protein n=1 Tax=Croceibacterium ferulae TaxID=1854641 RepID=UPI000F884342|nr:hypothetical protein [Croceibacterium ferulae]